MSRAWVCFLLNTSIFFSSKNDHPQLVLEFDTVATTSGAAPAVVLWRSLHFHVHIQWDSKGSACCLFFVCYILIVRLGVQPRTAFRWMLMGFTWCRVVLFTLACTLLNSTAALPRCLRNCFVSRIVGISECGFVIYDRIFGVAVVQKIPFHVETSLKRARRPKVTLIGALLFSQNWYGEGHLGTWSSQVGLPRFRVSTS